MEMYKGVAVVLEAAHSCMEVRGMVEKPAPGTAPSNLAVIGRYILPPTVMDSLTNAEAGAGGEIQLTDAIADLLVEKPVYAYGFTGVRFDCGNKLGYLQATVAYGLEHPDTGASFLEHLRELLSVSGR